MRVSTDSTSYPFIFIASATSVGIRDERIQFIKKKNREMPPRRQQRLDEVYERDMEQRIREILDERLEQVVDQLADRMAVMMDNRLRANPAWGNNNRRANSDVEVEGGEDDGDYEGVIPQNRRGRPRVHAPIADDNRRWESGMRTEIPEFHGSLQAEEFLDWLATVEEILEFKGVPEDKRVPLVATRLRGRATAWWQQLKLTRHRVGKSKIKTWEKMKKHLRAAFLPYNFQRLMYQRLQNLKQGSRTFDEYTTDFYQLVARNEIQEIEDQLVSRYIGGLRVQIQDTVNMFDPVSVSAAHQRALMVEKQVRRSGGRGGFGSSFSGGSSSGVGAGVVNRPGVAANRTVTNPLAEQGALVAVP